MPSPHYPVRVAGSPRMPAKHAVMRPKERWGVTFPTWPPCSPSLCCVHSPVPWRGGWMERTPLAIHSLCLLLPGPGRGDVKPAQFAGLRKKKAAGICLLGSRQAVLILHPRHPAILLGKQKMHVTSNARFNGQLWSNAGCSHEDAESVHLFLLCSWWTSSFTLLGFKTSLINQVWCLVAEQKGAQGRWSPLRPEDPGSLHDSRWYFFLRKMNWVCWIYYEFRFFSLLPFTR